MRHVLSKFVSLRSTMNAIKYVVLTLCTISILICYSINSSRTSKQQIFTLNETKNFLQNKTNTKNILYYYPMFGFKDFYMGTGGKVFESCEYTNCFVSYDKSLMAIDEWDALFFHIPERQRWIRPRKRKPHQRYIFYSMESPIQTFNRVEKYNNFFNYTMTYRRDSDVQRAYATIHKKRTEYQPPSLEEISKRPKKIAWFVSHCNADSRRDDLYKAINKLIPVDVYGECGNLQCKDQTKCYEMLENNYKFYLSFENSICVDYITEKTFLPLHYDVIPIVYSGANLSEVTPPNSVIDVQSFKSVKALVDYIKFLDEHPEEYLKYFEWKKEYIVERGGRLGMCKLCKKLHEDEGQTKVYTDLVAWWIGAEGGKHCTRTFINNFLKT